MNCKSKPFTQVDREYKITSKELKKKLGIEGEINHIGLSKGRSPDEIDKGKSADEDIWYITSSEKNLKSVYKPIE